MTDAVGIDRERYTRRVRTAFLYKWCLTETDRVFLVELDVRLLRFSRDAVITAAEEARLAHIELVVESHHWPEIAARA